jgi:hypothetical protein
LLLLLSSLLALGHALVLADRHLARMGGSRSSKRASRSSGCTGNNKGFRAETGGRQRIGQNIFFYTQATSRKKIIQHVLKTLNTLAICFAGACLPSTASRNADAASQRASVLKLNCGAFSHDRGCGARHFHRRAVPSRVLRSS